VCACLDNDFVTLVHVDTLLVKFEGQCHRSKFTVTEENVASVVSETSGEDFVVSSQSINGGRMMSRAVRIIDLSKCCCWCARSRHCVKLCVMCRVCIVCRV